jgi:hypothetical protein
MDAAQLIAKLAEVSPPLQPLDLGFFQTLQGPNNPSYSEFANTATMLSDAVRILTAVPPEKIDAVLAADRDLTMELQEELNKTFKNDPLGQFRSAQFVVGLVNTLMNRAGIRNR